MAKIIPIWHSRDMTFQPGKIMPKPSFARLFAPLAAFCLFNTQSPGFAQETTASSAPGYADLADLSTNAPLVFRAQVRDTIAVPPAAAAGVRPGYRRLYVTAQVTALIRGHDGIAQDISYLYDVPTDSRGKAPRLKKQTVLIFARQGTRPGEIQLVARDAQLVWTAETESTVKAILGEALRNGAPPRITGVGDAFHVAGTVAGEGETQIFLKTESGDPVSLSVIRRPGQQPRWAVALGEVVDEAAEPPKPNTLLWYRLACGLPPALPQQDLSALAPADAQAAQEDYALVLSGLGKCGRTRSSN